MWHQDVWHVPEVGCMYGRPSVMECEYHAYIYKTVTCNEWGGWRLRTAGPDTIYH